MTVTTDPAVERERIAARYAHLTPDYAGLCAAALEPGDRFLALAMAVTLAARSEPVPAPGFVLDAAVNQAAEQIARARHLGGSPASTARLLPQEATMLALVLSRAGLSVLDFGTTGHAPIPTLRARVPSSLISSVTRTGEGRFTTEDARLAFADGSFHDFRVLSTVGTPFWDEAVALTA